MFDAAPSAMTRKKHGKASTRPDDGVAFIPDPANGPVVSSDGFAEDMGKEFVTSATSGEESTADDHDAVQPEEIGGPFVETSADDEMGMNEDEEGTVEAVPTTSRSTRGR